MSSSGFEKTVCYMLKSKGGDGITDMLQSAAGNNDRGKHQEVEDVCNGALPQRGSTPQSNQLITCQPDALIADQRNTPEKSEVKALSKPPKSL